MFDRVFKRKDNAPYTELARKSRVEKRVPRPKTAPPAIGSPLLPAHERDACRDSRRSFQEGVVNRGYGGAQPSGWRSASPTVDDTTRNVEYPSRPVMDRSSSSTSCNIRNPFRSCNDSSQTLAMSRSPTRESSAEGVPVERAVRTFRAMHHEGYTNFAPQKAAIFTTNKIVSQHCDPFADENSIVTASPTTPTTLPANSSVVRGIHFLST
ncbi:hypothetical protein C8Q74DRAFT_1362755 [Fomes fomentarius]|nr:hypothetical protein C8Q74DRAFT_1362755 [Fomes fomentarius]